jgi:hypothetical protein
MVTEFNKILWAISLIRWFEHCSATYRYASAKQYFVPREQCICYSQASHNLTKASFIQKQAEKTRNTDLYTENISIQQNTKKLV